ncbi:MAG: YhbY family RNA-binding protein [Acidobacteriota bacterium]|nr:MAG: YhbY family RNA-binding protein [Acidobacteriota bacterium]
MRGRHTATGKQRRALRASIHHERAVVQIGKAGLDEGVRSSADDALAARETIKVAVGRSCPLAPKQALEQLAAALDAELVGVIGRTGILYRPRPARGPGDEEQGG